MKKATAVCCFMILLFLATFMNVDAMGPGRNGRRMRVNDGYFEDASSNGITEKREEMRKNICELARTLDCDRELKDK